MLPRFSLFFSTEVCLFYAPLYNYFAEKPNCLPVSVARNASAVYELAIRFARILERDASVRENFCYKETCVKKRVIMPVILSWLGCLRQAMRNTIFECVGDTLQVLVKMVDLNVRSGIVKYFVGWWDERKGESSDSARFSRRVTTFTVGVPERAPPWTSSERRASKLCYQTSSFHLHIFYIHTEESNHLIVDSGERDFWLVSAWHCR